MLVGVVAVEPTGQHDCIGATADTHQTLGASLPVVAFEYAQARIDALGHANGCHPGDTRFSMAQRGEYVAHTAIVNLPCALTAHAARAQGEDDGIHRPDSFDKPCGAGDVAFNQFTRGDNRLLAW